MASVNKLTLLNFEGPVLTLHKVRGLFVVTDEDRKIIDVLNRSELDEVIYGDRKIIDSRNRVWCYQTESVDAKPRPEKLENFIMTQEEAKDMLLKLYEQQIIDLTLVSKIKLEDSAIKATTKLKNIISGN
jgi:hypothetical protein